MPRTLARHLQDTDSKMLAVSDFIIGLYNDGDVSACRAALILLDELQRSWFQQIMLVAPGLRAVLD